MRSNTTSNRLEFIKDLVDNNKISSHEVANLATIDYPLFSFKYFDDKTIKGCKDYDFLTRFLSRLKKLSLLGWGGIRISGRHQYGMEPIPVNQIKCELPALVTPDVKSLDVFRAAGDNRVFIGLQQSRIFHVFFLETTFGLLYKH